MHVHHGMNRAALDRHLMALGGTVTILRRTGDIRYDHPLILETARGNVRRKDAPRSLTAFVQRVESVLDLRDNEAAVRVSVTEERGHV